MLVLRDSGHTSNIEEVTLLVYSHPNDKTDIPNKQYQSVFSSSENVNREEFSKSYLIPITDDQFLVI